MIRRWTTRKDQGAAAVEFVLVLPVLLLVIFGIVDFGRLLNAKLMLADAAQEGARAAALVDASEGRQTIDKALGTMSGSVDKVRVDDCGRTHTPGEDATVTLEYHFEFITPLAVLGGIGGENGLSTLTATAVMPCL